MSMFHFKVFGIVYLLLVQYNTIPLNILPISIIWCLIIKDLYLNRYDTPNNWYPVTYIQIK